METTTATPGAVRAVETERGKEASTSNQSKENVTANSEEMALKDFSIESHSFVRTMAHQNPVSDHFPIIVLSK
jgi:hypothetical protein